MGRPKLYEDMAAKHRAYRARLAAEMVRVNRKAWAALEARTDRVAAAVAAARLTGCPVAKQIGGTSRDTVLDELAAWFEARARAERGMGENKPAPSHAEAPANRRRKEGSAPPR